MFGVVGRSLYGDTAPDHFGTLWQSIFTCFVLLTLDDWFDIYSNVIKVDPGKHIHPFYKTCEKVSTIRDNNLTITITVDRSRTYHHFSTGLHCGRVLHISQVRELK